jgi:glycosyltransferase involved in cell wall biosynthesis
MTGERVPLVSVVVPTRNSARTIKACLVSVRAQTYQLVEIIVVDNHSSDKTAAFALDIADRLVVAGPERSAQRNSGAAAASGDFLLFIDSDMILSPTVVQDVVDTFAVCPLAVALIVPELVKEENTFWVQCRALEKRAYVGDAGAEAARAFRATWFDKSGGFDESLTGPEDWELTDRARRQSDAVGRTSAVVFHDEGGLSLRIAFSKKRYYGRSWSDYVRKHPAGSRRLARASLARPLRTITSDPLHVAGLYLLKASELLGFVIGSVEESVRRRRQARATRGSGPPRG